jgi:hypothetical protein
MPDNSKILTQLSKNWLFSAWQNISLTSAPLTKNQKLKEIYTSPLQELDELIFSYLPPEDLAKTDLICKQLAKQNQKLWQKHLITFFKQSPIEVTKLVNPRLAYAEQIKKLTRYYVVGEKQIQYKPFYDPFNTKVIPLNETFPKDKFYIYPSLEKAQAQQRELEKNIPKHEVKYYGATYSIFRVKLIKQQPYLRQRLSNKKADNPPYFVDRSQIQEFKSIEQSGRFWPF